MGQGFSVAQGSQLPAVPVRISIRYCMVGDGELQEGPIWEAVMYAGQKHLDNLCVLVDQNNGQLDISSRMVFPMPDLEPSSAPSDGMPTAWMPRSTTAVYAGAGAVLASRPRNGKPTAIVCNSTKG